MEAAIALARDEGRSRLLVATAAADIGNLRFYQRLGFRIHSVERDAFTPATGYKPGLLIGGIELRDRVWLDRGVDDYPGAYSRMRPSSWKPTAAYTRSAISVDCRLAVWQPRASASYASSAVNAVPSPRRRARSSVQTL